MTLIAKNCGTFADFRLAQEWVGSQLRKQSISNNFHGRNLGQEASRQCWSVAILDFLTSPFPFEHLWPTEIREITHCYNFLWRWLLPVLPGPSPGPQPIFKNRSLGSGLNFLTVAGSHGPRRWPDPGPHRDQISSFSRSDTDICHARGHAQPHVTLYHVSSSLKSKHKYWHIHLK